MRHGKKVNHLGRKTAHRKAMLANMACSLIEHKRINTTVAKAKALKQFVEPLITKSKPENNVTAEKGTHNRRIAFKNLRDKYAVNELFSVVAEKVADRPGGYTRIIKLGNRLGDNADMAMIELVDFNELYNAGKSKKKSTRRSRRSKGNKENVAEEVKDTKAEEVASESIENQVDTAAETETQTEPEVESTPKPEAEAATETKVEETETPEVKNTTEDSEKADEESTDDKKE